MWTARLNIAGVVSRTQSVGLGKLSWADLLTLYVQRGKMEVEDVTEDSAAVQLVELDW